MLICFFTILFTIFHLIGIKFSIAFSTAIIAAFILAVIGDNIRFKRLQGKMPWKFKKLTCINNALYVESENLLIFIVFSLIGIFCYPILNQMNIDSSWINTIKIGFLISGAELMYIHKKRVYKKFFPIKGWFLVYKSINRKRKPIFYFYQVKGPKEINSMKDLVNILENQTSEYMKGIPNEKNHSGKCFIFNAGSNEIIKFENFDT